MKIIIQNKKRKTENIQKEYPDAVIIDVTSNGNDEFAKLSPFYPVGNIPVPGMKSESALCVEGIWQGLKVFEREGYDKSYFHKARKNIKRTVKRFGKVKGHHYNGVLLGYIEARKKIYLPAYKYVLEQRMPELLQKIKKIASEKQVVLLDYTTNDSIMNTEKPLAHAAVIKAVIMNDSSFLEQKQENNINPTQPSLF